MTCACSQPPRPTRPQSPYSPSSPCPENIFLFAVSSIQHTFLGPTPPFLGLRAHSNPCSTTSLCRAQPATLDCMILLETRLLKWIEALRGSSRRTGWRVHVSRHHRTIPPRAISTFQKLMIVAIFIGASSSCCGCTALPRIHRSNKA